MAHSHFDRLSFDIYNYTLCCNNDDDGAKKNNDFSYSDKTDADDLMNFHPPSNQWLFPPIWADVDVMLSCENSKIFYVALILTDD